MNQQQQFEQQFNERVAAKIKDMTFPGDKIPDGFRDYLTLSMPVFTFHSVKCTLEEFDEVAQYAAFGGELSMIQAFVAMQMMRGATAKDLGVNLVVYIEMNKHLEAMALEWDIITKPIKEKVNRKLNEEFEMQLKANTLKKNTPRIHLPN